MIKVNELKRSSGCSTCDNDATKELVFKDPFSPSATTIKLCDNCIEELKTTLTSQ